MVRCKLYSVFLRTHTHTHKKMAAVDNYTARSFVLLNVANFMQSVNCTRVWRNDDTTVPWQHHTKYCTHFCCVSSPPNPPPTGTASSHYVQALLKPQGEALTTFEQRRSNVEGFYGPPRFGTANDLDCDDGNDDGSTWEHGEELDFGEGVAMEGLRDAAKAARVRMFRIRRRT